MIRLPRSLQSWGRPQFDDVLKGGVEQIDPAELPLRAWAAGTPATVAAGVERPGTGDAETMRLIKSLNAWGTPEFDDVLKRELEQLDPDALPLQQGLSRGSYALGERWSVMVIAAADEAGVIRAKVGIFYRSIIAGCSCADDPTPVDELSEYCVLQLDIDRQTAETKVTLLAD